MLNLFLTMLWFFLWIMWLMLLFRVVADIFRDDGLGGWGKAGWVIVVCVLPFLGVFVYLIARGKDMGEREFRHAQRKEQEMRSYIQDVAADAPAPANGNHHGVDELERLVGMRKRGDITEDDYQRAKEKLLTV
ncbi:SHOCT domain-containing protein [Amycolatopsis carbonis]|uniref:SHOCT domain-containing protein n=1 Tax=Amycolatopsis carbonis TaxID=715471 RepID=A0A9Y2ICP9_9PSEU|nr:SHOCT domain-containing protein [Amycolatopsis sp. 2-15]WIX76846.1 SHOCT domain-containing protein [Amycolatopsis sp. 2-15]